MCKSRKRKFSGANECVTHSEDVIHILSLVFSVFVSYTHGLCMPHTYKEKMKIKHKKYPYYNLKKREKIWCVEKGTHNNARGYL